MAATNWLLPPLPRTFRGDVDVSEATLERYSRDTSLFYLRPAAAVYPRDAADLGRLVKYANRHQGHVSLTARAAGTDMSGGPLTTSIVVDFLRYFNRVIEVKDQRGTVLPGTYYRDFEAATLRQGWILPSYTASRELNTVGGMVANNSAGEKSLTYGKTDRYVHSLKAVLCDGNEYTLRKLSRRELQEKQQLRTFEGAMYRQLEKLITRHHPTIRAERPRVSKNSAGYAIWDVWNETDDTFDLCPLFVGSQGTLGLITEITFNLVTPKPASRMLVMFLRPRHLKQLGAIVNAVLAAHPESFESYDDKTFRVMLRVFPKLLQRLGNNPFTLLRNFWPEIKMLMAGGIPKLVLMAEFSAATDEEALQQAEAAQRLVAEYGLSVRITATPSEAEKFWTIRRESFALLREHVHGKHTAPFIDDFVVAPEHLPEFLPRLYTLLDQHRLLYTVAGHIGNGNFHIIPLMDLTRPDLASLIAELSKKVYALVAEYHGSITGEHNDGLIRTPFLHTMFSPKMLGVFSEIKQIFDPYRIFNPHKKVDPLPDLLHTAIGGRSAPVHTH